MLKFLRVDVKRADKFGVLDHGEQQKFRDGTEDGFLYIQGF